MVVRAIRGAIQLEHDERTHLLKSTAELLAKMMHANNLDDDQLVSILFTVTKDINSEYPALAVKELGLEDVPVMCFVAMDVAGAKPMIISALINANMDSPRSEVNHVYLRGAEEIQIGVGQ